MSFLYIAFRKLCLQHVLKKYQTYFYLASFYEFTWRPISFDRDNHFVISLQIKPVDSLLAWRTDIVLCLNTNFDLWVRRYFIQLIEQYNNQTFKTILKAASTRKLSLPLSKSVHFEDEVKSLNRRPSCALTGKLVNLNPTDGTINTQLNTYKLPKDPRQNLY